MSLSPTPRDIHAAKTKAYLAETALRLFSSYSIEQVTIDEICAACNVTKGAFYYHFPSKDHIITYAVNYKLDCYIEENFQVSPLQPVKERLHHLYQLAFSFFQMLGKPMTRYSYEGQIRSLIKLKQPERSYVHLLSDIIEDGIQNKQFRSHLAFEDCYMMAIMLHTGFLFKWSSTPEELDHQYHWDAILENMIALLFI